MKKKIKKYSKENVRIQIKEFELKDVSFFGCDACFDFEIRDKETDVLLATDYVTIENAFMGVVDSDDIYYFLEEKGIDFDKEYDGSFHNLPADLQKEYEDYELEYYNEVYHEQFFDDNDSSHEWYVKKIMDQIYLEENKFYIIHGKDVAWISATQDYFGIHLHSDDVEIHQVYNLEEQKYIYKAEGIYFDISASYDSPPNFGIHFYKRIKNQKCVVTRKGLRDDYYPGYMGWAGDVLYGYDDIE